MRKTQRIRAGFPVLAFAIQLRSEWAGTPASGWWGRRSQFPFLDLIRFPICLQPERGPIEPWNTLRDGGQRFPGYGLGPRAEFGQTDLGL